jgi:hypothetical protein
MAHTSYLDIKAFIANLLLFKNLTLTKNLWKKPRNFVANIY